MLKKLIYSMASIALLANFCLFASAAEGENLERKMWQDIQDRNWKDFEKKLAPYFQAATQDDGPLSREQYISHVKQLDVNEYTLSNFTVTEHPDTMVITYEVTATENVHGTPISSRATRLTVWQKNSNAWQWIAHAVLIPFPPGETKK